MGKIIFKHGEVVTLDHMNQLLQRDDIIKLQLDIHKKLLEKFYSKKKLTKLEQMRKDEIEFIISYLEIDDIYETLTESRSK